ncbi:hypothetical protein BJD55_gp020 [Gordonia phage Yvonnetastic]|uniref:Uncharacterized protein n=1 Tax=Gordonia phage Yvonnetastic TaxID=1821566 RepID=A0A142K9G3_9CAUD|nr:hypothetical protein BJD55_gp020 [Gordonia phage Yvonnetastic]AMS02746.1 hypothetical protein SEA_YVONNETASTIC_202 [Gordonia phage Yvonnetastic]WKW86173.1 hypothetical protein SEA_JONJAMES_201 [Gordonia Phage JonJames]
MRNSTTVDMAARIARDTLMDGGGTFSPATGGHVDISALFVVAVSKSLETRTELSGITTYDRWAVRADVDKYLDTHRKQWLAGLFLGTWIHNGYVYLDVVETFADQHKAHTAAIERGQLAYYDGRNSITRHVGSRYPDRF